MKLLNELLELLFPRTCLICCRRLMPSEQHICLSCHAELPFTHFTATSPNPLEEYCRQYADIFRAIAWVDYVKGAPETRLIKALKYQQQPEVGIFLGRLMAKQWMAYHWFDGMDFMVPIPLSKRKARQRGYNQAEKIAQGISEITGIPIRCDVVRRKHHTLSQTHKGAADRWQNMINQFEVVQPSLLEGKHLLLVDDVITTGATLLSCANEIHKVVPQCKLSIATYGYTQLCF